MKLRPSIDAVVPFVALAPLLLALGRPVAIDDPLFLRVAEQVSRDPLRPLSGTFNWFGESQPLWLVFPNPPGLPYWLATVEALGGTSEPALHLALLPFAVAAALAGRRLAGRFAGDSPWVTAAWVASPAFLLSASTLMADVPSFALALWAVALYVDGVDADRGARRGFAALLAGMSMLVKYTALLILPTMALYALVMATRARRWRCVLDLWPVLLPVAAWSALTLATDGRLHMVDSLFLVGGVLVPNQGWTMARWFVHRGIALLACLAAAGVFPLLFVGQALSTPVGRLLAGLALVVGFSASLAAPFVWLQPGLPDWTPVIVGLLVAVGACALLIALTRAGRREDAFLAGWVMLQVAFAWLWSWTIAVRFVVPALPPLALLLARAPGRRPAAAGLLAAASLVGLLVAAVVLIADASGGDFHRRELPAFAARVRSEGRHAYVVGAWGFQYYAERAGMERLDRRQAPPRVGDLVLQPYYASSNDLPASLIGRIDKVADVAGLPPFLRVHTMNPFVGAGFYSSLFGPLPFTLSREPAEGIIVWTVTPERARER